MTVRDQRGARIEAGCHVAYNLSGTVAAGEVLEVTVTPVPAGSPSWATERVEIKVKLAHPADGHEAGHVSKVRNRKNVLVLRGPRHDRGLAHARA